MTVPICTSNWCLGMSSMGKKIEIKPRRLKVVDHLCTLLKSVVKSHVWSPCCVTWSIASYVEHYKSLIGLRMLLYKTAAFVGSSKWGSSVSFKTELKCVFSCLAVIFWVYIPDYECKPSRMFFLCTCVTLCVSCMCVCVLSSCLCPCISAHLWG